MEEQLQQIKYKAVCCLLCIYSSDGCQPCKYEIHVNWIQQCAKISKKTKKNLRKKDYWHLFIHRAHSQ
jgi:hypothetical protein